MPFGTNQVIAVLPVACTSLAGRTRINAAASVNTDSNASYSRRLPGLRHQPTL